MASQTAEDILLAYQMEEFILMTLYVVDVILLKPYQRWFIVVLLRYGHYVDMSIFTKLSFILHKWDFLPLISFWYCLLVWKIYSKQGYKGNHWCCWGIMQLLLCAHVGICTHMKVSLHMYFLFYVSIILRTIIFNIQIEKHQW